MRPRDEQDYELRRQQIIDGALTVFSSKGFEKATNKDIANAAGIGSPGLIYHYFQDKTDLLQNVLEQHAPVFQLFMHPETLMGLPPREGLMLFARSFLNIVENPTTIAVIKVMWGEALRRPDIAALINSIGPGRVFPLITQYLQQQMQAGTIRCTNPGAAARCFLGSLLAYVITREIFPQPDTHMLDPETMAHTTVEIFLQGMLEEPW